LLRRIGRGIVYGALFGALGGLLGGGALLLVEMRRQGIGYVGPELSLLAFTAPLGTGVGAVIGAIRGFWT
jgi:hypothetical protein